MEKTSYPSEKDADNLLEEKSDNNPTSRLLDKDLEHVNPDESREENTVSMSKSELLALIANKNLDENYVADVDYKVSITIEKKAASCSESAGLLKFIRKFRKKSIEKIKYSGKAIDISPTGILLEVSPEVAGELPQALSIKLKFTIEPGSTPENYSMKVDIGAKHVQTIQGQDGKMLCGVLFTETLSHYAARHKHWYVFPKFFKSALTSSKDPKPEILLKEKSDRRLLSKLPAQDGSRTNLDRRRSEYIDSTSRNEMAAIIDNENLSKRYLVDYEVLITIERKATYYNESIDVSSLKRKSRKESRKKIKYYGRAIDISATGVLLEVLPEVAQAMSEALSIKLNFTIEPGSMPEGYEMKVDIGAKCIRTGPGEGGKMLCGMIFSRTLAQYATRNKNWYMLSIASFLLFVVTACIMLMRTESVIYFRFNKVLYFYSILAATFLLTRYLFGALYRPVPIDPSFTPGVTVIIPCFNEEEWIEKTILGCINQDYPVDKLEVIVVDDCSTDKSFEIITNFIETLKVREKSYDLENMIRYVRQEQNAGKRDAMARGALMAKHELLVFVDSDSFLEPFAVRNIVQPFKDNKMGGVSGRTDVANTYTNALTKMQSVRYYIAFRVMKAAESVFDTVSCLSGPLSCYRKDLVLRYLDPWLNQRFLGEKATFGDDRAMTNFILRKNRTCYQDTAVCNTIVPNKHKVFLKQQMRWKRSWLRESMLASGFMWKKEPFAALTFYMGVLVPVLAPVIVIYNAIYVPIVYKVFPTTFLAGLLLMALLMAMSQLLLRKSSTWLYGLMFCVYYVGVLLWQMPYAWVTFWKSTWGTRPTPADLLDEERSKNRKLKLKSIRLWGQKKNSAA